MVTDLLTVKPIDSPSLICFHSCSITLYFQDLKDFKEQSLRKWLPKVILFQLFHFDYLSYSYIFPQGLHYCFELYLCGESGNLVLNLLTDHTWLLYPLGNPVVMKQGLHIPSCSFSLTRVTFILFVFLCFILFIYLYFYYFKIILLLW